MLSRLIAEGLVLAEGQRGFEVAPATPSGFKEAAGLRLLLETHAVELSFGAGDLDWEARLVAAHHRLSALEGRMPSADQDDLAAIRRYDRAFHRALIAACGSDLLIETFTSIHDRYLRYVTIAAVFRGAASAGEHAELLACGLARNAGRAAEVLKVHIESCLDCALAAGGGLQEGTVAASPAG